MPKIPRESAAEPEQSRRSEGVACTPHHADAVVLERDVPLAQSLIWRRLREYYHRRGLQAWTKDSVPQYLTNNPFLAEIYARIAFSFLSDCLATAGNRGEPASPQNPLRILELGAGSGKFAYLCLRQLTALLRDRDMPSRTVRYTMTDCSESLVQSWRTNAQLAEFVEKGILHFEPLQLADEGHFTLGRNGSSTPRVQRSPVIVVANYVFDSLPQDAFVIHDGQLFEALLTSAGEQQPDGSAPESLADLKRSYKNVIVGAERYEDLAWNGILEQYRSRLSAAATILFPSVVLKTLQRLSELSDGRMLVLAADKGYAHEEELALCQGPPTIEFHGGDCFSQMVNFDALGKYFAATGGQSFVPERRFNNLSVCAFLQKDANEEFAATTRVCEELQGAFGPDDLFALLSWLNPYLEQMSLSQALSLLRLSRWDPVVLLRLFPVMSRQLRNAVGERDDVRRAVMSVWANHYPLNLPDHLLPFYCGVMLMELRFFEEALSFFVASQQTLGPSAATSYNRGLCLAELGRSPEAFAAMVEACELDPQFEPAQSARAKLESKK